MIHKQHTSKEFKEYLAKAAELAESRKELGGRVGQLSLVEAQSELNQLNMRTKELYALRESLHPTSVFLLTHNIQVVNDHTVSFTIAQGCSRIEVLEKAVELFPTIEPGRAFPIQRLVSDFQLSEWRTDRAFTTPVAEAYMICIDGHVEGGRGLNEDEQLKLLEQRGLAMAHYADLAVAAVAFYLATGECLFGCFNKTEPQSYVVRVVPSWRKSGPGALWINRWGLAENEVYPASKDPCIALSAVAAKSC